MSKRQRSEKDPLVDAAKRGAHEWERAIRRREARTTSAAVKTVAAALADRASLVTAELAEDLGLPPGLVGAIVAWPKIATLAADVGQRSEGTTRGYLKALEGDLAIFERRHMRLSSAYVLAADGAPLRAASFLDGSEERPLGSKRSRGESARLDPSGRGAKAPAWIQSERPLESKRDDRSDPSGPSKEEPISEPISEPRGTRADARETPPPSTSISTPKGIVKAPPVELEAGPVVAAKVARGRVTDERQGALDLPAPPTALMERARSLLTKGYQRRYEALAQREWSGEDGRSCIGRIAAFCVAQGDAELERRVDACLDGFFAREDLRKRRRWPWEYLAEDPGHYAAVGSGEAPAPSKRGTRPALARPMEGGKVPTLEDLMPGRRRHA